MPLVKPLCLVCERPTADGAIQAAQVDKEKLQAWYHDVCERQLNKPIRDTDLICYFCIWQAEFSAERDLNTLVWWPPDLHALDGSAKVLREKFLEGKAEQCWVQLERIVFPAESNKREHGEPQASTQSRKKKCFYCGKEVVTMNQHLIKWHKDAIRCPFHNCATFFRTTDERKEHIRTVHEKSKNPKTFKCSFCSEVFNRFYHRIHIERVHPEYSVKCAVYGCRSYFKKEEELAAHHQSAHKRDGKTKKEYSCHFCGYANSHINTLARHICGKHLAKVIKCDKCDKMFATKFMLDEHVRQLHTFWVCTICSWRVVVGGRGRHFSKVRCVRCKRTFGCSGEYQTHLDPCRKKHIQCDQCQETFSYPALLQYHKKEKHRNDSWSGLQYEKLGFKCDACKRYFSCKNYFRAHMRYHAKSSFKQCAHCPKNFSRLVFLKQHLADEHYLIEPTVQCKECDRKFTSPQYLTVHDRSVHVRNKNRVPVSCTICGKSMMGRAMTRHLLIIHGVVRNNNRR